MRREFHVRFCEGLGVQFPRATRLVVVFSHRYDARRVLDVLPKRFGKYGLELHPEKTRLVRFRRPAKGLPPRVARNKNGPESFDFLGFTHHWGKSNKGNWVVKQRTSSARISRTVRRANQWCRKHRHKPVSWQHQQLLRALQGHYAYFGITGNIVVVRQVKRAVVARWWKWLNRRSQRKGVPWPRMLKLLKRYPLPWPRVVRHFTMAPTT